MARLLNLAANAYEADPVAAELRRWAAEPAPDARAVCALSVLDYLERVLEQRLHPSPRLLSSDRLAAIWRRPGRFEAFASWAMRRLGCPPTGAPARGDVGLVELRGSGLTACLCVGPERWAARGAGEVVVESGRAVLAWSVRRGRRSERGPRCPRR